MPTPNALNAPRLPVAGLVTAEDAMQVAEMCFVLGVAARFRQQRQR